MIPEEKKGRSVVSSHHKNVGQTEIFNKYMYKSL
jgi:hypothetical protein